MFADVFDETFVFSIDMRARFRNIEHREGMLVRRGDLWSEWSPFLEYPDEEAATWLRAALEDCAAGQSPSAPADDPVDDVPVHRNRIPVNVTVPVVSPRRAADLVRASGCRTAKVKVADPNSCLSDDLARLASVRQALGPEGNLRVDANGAWTVDHAEHVLEAMAGFDLQYVEQPCASVEELAELRERLSNADTPVAIAADESIRLADDPDRVAELGAADVIVLKNQPLGGRRRCVEIAERLGMSAVISSALETSIGIWAGLRAAAALPSLDLACGLNTVKLLADDVIEQPLIATDGYLDLGERPRPSAKALKKVKADAHRQTWWHDRLDRCLELVMAEQR